MRHELYKSQIGAGLIEVMIALVIVASGLLVLSVFQTNVTSESRVNKIRSEAVNICENTLANYQRPLENLPTIVGGTSTDSGLLDNYSITITPTTSTAGDYVRVNVNCVSDSFPDDISVTLSTLVTTHSSVASVLGTAGSGNPGANSISLNANSSNEVLVKVDVADIFEAKDTSAYETPNGVALRVPGTGDVPDTTYVVTSSDGTTAALAELCSTIGGGSLSHLSDGSGLKARRGGDGAEGDPFGYNPELLDATQIKNKLFTRLTVEKIELYQVETVTILDNAELISPVEYCIPVVRYNGGVIVRIAGTVHSVRGLPEDIFTFDISETGTYCVFEPSALASSAPYICYVGGNCNNNTGDDAAELNTNNFFACPSNQTTLAAISSDVGVGGWRGSLGLINTEETDFNACFNEELTEAYPSDETLAYRATARNYFTTNTVEGEEVNQGLNQPMLCHDFALIDAAGSLKEAGWIKTQNKCINDIGDTLAILSKVKERTLDSTLNTYDATPDNFCSQIEEFRGGYLITGTYYFEDPQTPQATPYISVEQNGTVLKCDLSGGDTYNCLITDSAFSAGTVKINGKYGDTVSCEEGATLGQPDPSGALNAVSGCALTLAPFDTESYEQISYNGSIEGTIYGTSLSSSASGGAIIDFELADLTAGNEGQYDCTVTPASTDDAGDGTYSCTAIVALNPNSENFELKASVIEAYEIHETDQEVDPTNPSITTINLATFTSPIGPSISVAAVGEEYFTTDVTVSFTLDPDIGDVSKVSRTVFSAESGNCPETALDVFTCSFPSVEVSGANQTVDITFTLGGDVCRHVRLAPDDSPNTKTESVQSVTGDFVSGGSPIDRTESIVVNAYVSGGSCN